jgi:hypothetical protein
MSAKMMDYIDDERKKFDELIELYSGEKAHETVTTGILWILTEEGCFALVQRKIFGAFRLVS